MNSLPTSISEWFLQSNRESPRSNYHESGYKIVLHQRVYDFQSLLEVQLKLLIAGAYLVFCVRGHNMSKQGVMYDRCKQAGTPAQDEGTLF
jgi:hypothetical protein